MKELFAAIDVLFPVEFDSREEVWRSHSLLRLTRESLEHVRGAFDDWSDVVSVLEGVDGVVNK